MPSLNIRKLISDNSHNTWCHSDIASHTQDEQHEKENYRENLKQKFKFYKLGAEFIVPFQIKHYLWQPIKFGDSVCVSIDKIALKLENQQLNYSQNPLPGYDTKARPAPPLTTEPMSLDPVKCAKWPSIAKIVQPATKDVNVSNNDTIVESLYMLCENLLYDEYIIMLPKHTDNEKKHCVTAAYHTCNAKE